MWSEYEITDEEQEELFTVLDSALTECYMSWFHVYAEHKPDTEMDFLQAVYTHFRYAYALGIRDGISIGKNEELGPVLSLVEELQRGDDS